MNCVCVQYQAPESDEDVPLAEIFNKLLEFIEASPHLNKTYEKIEMQCEIQRDGYYFWTEDGINRAWRIAKKMDKTLEKKRWFLAIMLQLVKRTLRFDESERNEAQPEQSNVGNLSQSCGEESVADTPDPMKAENGSASKDQLPSGNEKAHETQIGEGSNKPTIYIRIPLSEMFKNESTSQGGRKSEEKDRPTYKLIDRCPFLHEIKKKKSYVMLYNNQTRNAAWVYEILNRETVPLGDTTAPPNEAAKKVAGLPSRNKSDFKYEDDSIEPLYEAAKNIEVCNESDYENSETVPLDDTTAPPNEAAKKVAGLPSRNKSDFKYEDDTIDPLYEATKNIEECNESDYERGHLASAANHKWCQEAYEDTFFLSNIAPQVPAFNQDLWKKLEDLCEMKIGNQNDMCNVHVYSGPLYLLGEKKKREKLKIWKSKVVPTHFFKVIIVEHNDGRVELECYEIPNEKPNYENDQSKDKNNQSKDKNNQSKDKNIQSKDKKNQSKDKNNQSKDKKNQSKDKNNQSKDKNNQSKDKNSQSKDKNSQSKDSDELESYRVPIKQIETDSGLRFTESSCTEKETDSIREVKWEGKDADGKPCSAKIKVTVSTPLTDYNDFVYI